MTLDLENINQQAAELGVHYLKIAPPAVMDLSRAMRDELEADHKLLVGAFTLSTRGEIVLKAEGGAVGAGKRGIEGEAGMSVDPKSSYYDAGGIETIAVIKAKLDT